MKLVIASNNKGKIKEYRQLLEPLGYEVLSQKEAGVFVQPEETGRTFEENAEIKARAVRELCSGAAVLADDSGLEVDALDGQPGVYSARYGGEELDDKGRTALLLKNMEKVPEDQRTARFVCVICFIDDWGNIIKVRGECEGTIGYSPLGENGFGYDPVFIYQGKSFAQHGSDLKNQVSHRAEALKKLISELQK